MELLPLLLRFLFEYPDDPVLERCWAQTERGTTLDLGCGVGRVLAKALNANQNISGIDHEPAIVQAAQEFLNEESIETGRKQMRVELKVGDFTSTDLSALQNAPFQTIICAANTWSMVLDEGQRRNTLQACRKAMAPNGRLVIWIKNDQASADGERTVKKDTPFGSAEMNLKWRENLAEKRRKYSMRLTLGAKTETHEFETALLSCTQVLSEFSGEGFEVENSFGNFPDLPLDPVNSPLQIYILKVK